MVLSRGVGKPDYRVSTRPEKTLSGTGQTLAGYVSTVSIPSSSSLTFTLFTVPSGYRFNIATATFSCDASLIQKLVWKPNGSSSGWTYLFDTSFILTDTPTGGAGVYDGGEYLEITLYNNDTSTRTFYIAVWGNMEEVS